MTIKVMHSNSVFEEINKEENYFNWLDRYFLIRSHPRKIIFSIVSTIWSTYFLWNGNWQIALSFFLLMEALGFFMTRKIDPELMAQTTIGKMGLLHSHPFNLVANIIGIIMIIYALWTHDGVSILIGLSIVFFGHFFGWSSVNSKLQIN